MRGRRSGLVIHMNEQMRATLRKWQRCPKIPAGLAMCLIIRNLLITYSEI